MRFFSLLEPDDSRIGVRHFALLKRPGTVVIGIGFLIYVAIMMAGLASGDRLMSVIGAALAAVSFLVGAIMVAMAFRVTWIKTDDRRIRIGDQMVVRGDISGVRLYRATRRAHSQHHSQDYSVWNIDLITNRVPLQPSQSTNPIYSATRQCGADEVTEMAGSLRQLREVQGQVLPANLDDEDAGVPVKVDLCELDAWRVARRLARNLDVPLIDSSTPEIQAVLPSDVGSNLGELLNRHGACPEDPGPPPPAMRTELLPERLILHWRVQRRGYALGLGLIAAVSSCLGWGTASASPAWVSPMFWGLTLLLVIAMPFIDRDHGRHRLVVDRRDLRWESQRKSKPVQMPTCEIEALWADERDDGALRFVSGRRLIACPMDPAQAQHQRVEYAPE